MRLDRYLADRLGSRSAAQAAIASGRVTVDGVIRPKSFEVTGAEAVEIASDENDASEAPHSSVPVQVVHEDEDVLVVDKAPGQIVHPGAGVRGPTLVDALMGRIPAGKLGEGTDIGAAVVYLSSREAGYVTGQTLHVNGGMAML